MRGKRIGKGIKLLILSCLMVSVMAMTAFADFPSIVMDKTGSITVIMNTNSNGTGDPVGGGEMTIYQVAEVCMDPDSGDYSYQVIEPFTGSSYDFEWQLEGKSGEDAKIDWALLADEFSDYVSVKNIKGETKEIASNGLAIFDGLYPGLYLLVQTRPAEGYDAANPFLVSMPQYNGDPENPEYIYAVDASPKTEAKELIDISGEKTWDDGDDQDGKRPESITIRLWADGEEIDIKTVTEADGWKWSFTGLPVHDENGYEIQYRITEDEMPDYSTTYDGYDITNSYTPGQTSLTAVKFWDDSGDADGIRTGSVTVELLADNEETGRTIVLDASNNWTGSFTELDQYHEGSEISYSYSVKEYSVNGYGITVNGDMEHGYMITNSHTPSESTRNSTGSSSGGGGSNGGGVRQGTESGPGADTAGGVPSSGDSSSTIHDTISSDDIGALPATGENNTAAVLMGFCAVFAVLLAGLLYMRHKFFKDQA